ncbi:extracellular solute-binding protein [Rhizobium rhizosphaerae]|uniref:extracellular solute-binding protein n=1 Tax=Xaviernesmea rhizosphaerae TaxID=1672749 RepID=UPI00098F4BC3|nr:extracellular solute-binding protein [Xaviernesmea rhizosphaerae]
MTLRVRRPFACLLQVLALGATIALGAAPVLAQDAAGQTGKQAQTGGQAAAPVWRHGLSMVGPLKYAEGFQRFDYVNAAAPQGGEVRLNIMGSFDSTNPLLAKGDLAVGLVGPAADASGMSMGLVFETLMKPSMDEISSTYGLIAEAVSFPEDIAWAKFRLRAEARWSDGTPITPEDVIFSFEQTKALNPQSEFYYKHVVKAEKTAEREVTFTFDETGNKELPHILGGLLIVPKLWWQGQGPDGKARDISRTTLEAPMGSGPYRLVSIAPGSALRYERNPDYWGKDLPVNIGQNNFAAISFTYFADLDVAFEAFRSGNADYRWENSARRWATAYDFPAVKDGRIVRESLENDNRNSGVMVGFIYNLRRDKFQNPKLREALNYAFDFEELKRTIFFGQYDRIDSFFYRTELASSGLPQGKELEILQGLKDQVPADVFTKPYLNPVGGDPTKMRENLRQAIALLKEAGYELKNNRMVNVKTGEPLTFEILLDGNTIERVALPFSQNLKRIGIEASVRSVDSAQFTNRWRGRDFDMLYLGWAQSLNPGNEQTEYWGSQAAAREGSQNFSGISNPGVDALIRKVIFARDREELVAATHALDRVLLAHHIIVPTYASKNSNIAYAKRLKHPDPLPEYAVGFPALWWSQP